MKLRDEEKHGLKKRDKAAKVEANTFCDTVNGERLTTNRISILQLMVENPYITKDEMATITGLNASTIMRNIEKMRGKYLRRVGSDKNGFWEIID